MSLAMSMKARGQISEIRPCTPALLEDMFDAPSYPCPLQLAMSISQDCSQARMAMDRVSLVILSTAMKSRIPL